MQLYPFFGLATMFFQAVAATNSTLPTRLNGWFPCRGYTFSEDGGSYGQSECATYSAPLCYPSVCKVPQFADPTVDIFVKRMLAVKGDPETASNVWLLQGGPGFSSTGLESSMLGLFTQLDGTANVYTMDQRGTGRSTFLDCVAAQATTTGSPNGEEIDPSEVGACAQSLENEYGNLASFSTTSAANDVVTFIAKYTNGASTIVYGTSYGTMLVERVMHLAPPKVTGYVLDGITTTSGSPADKHWYMSKVDGDVGEVADHFMALCTQHKSCSSHFTKPNTLANTLQDVRANFDKDPNSTCATLFSGNDVQPSYALRMTLASMLMDPELRKLIPRSSTASNDVTRMMSTP